MMKISNWSEKNLKSIGTGKIIKKLLKVIQKLADGGDTEIHHYTIV